MMDPYHHQQQPQQQQQQPQQQYIQMENVQQTQPPPAQYHGDQQQYPQHVYHHQQEQQAFQQSQQQQQQQPQPHYGVYNQPPVSVPPSQPIRNDQVTSPHMTPMMVPSSPMQIASPASSVHSFQHPQAAAIQRRDSTAGSGRSPRGGEATPLLPSPVHSPGYVCPIPVNQQTMPPVKQSPIKTPTTPQHVMPMDQSSQFQQIEAPPVSIPQQQPQTQSVGIHPMAIAAQEAAERSALLEQYREAYAQTQEVEQRLAKVKRQKKNLMARQRTWKKNNTGPEQADIQALENFNNEIQAVQKELDHYKRNERSLALKLEEMGVQLPGASGTEESERKTESSQPQSSVPQPQQQQQQPPVTSEQVQNPYWYGDAQQQFEQQSQQQFSQYQQPPQQLHQQQPQQFSQYSAAPTSMPPPPPISSPRFTQHQSMYPPQTMAPPPQTMVPYGFPPQPNAHFFPSGQGSAVSGQIFPGQQQGINPYNMPYGMQQQQQMAMQGQMFQQPNQNFRPPFPGQQQSGQPYFQDMQPSSGQFSHPVQQLQQQHDQQAAYFNHQQHQQQQQHTPQASPMKPVVTSEQQQTNQHGAGDFYQVPSPHKLNASMQNAMTHPPQGKRVSQTGEESSTDVDESTLTDDQRRQLKLIEGMPLTREVVNGQQAEVSGDDGDKKKKKVRSSSKKVKPEAMGPSPSIGFPPQHQHGAPMYPQQIMMPPQQIMMPPEMQQPPVQSSQIVMGQSPVPTIVPFPPQSPQVPPGAPPFQNPKRPRKVKPEKAAALLEKLRSGPGALGVVQPIFAAQIVRPAKITTVADNPDQFYGDSQFSHLADAYSSFLVPQIARKLASSPTFGMTSDNNRPRVPELPEKPYLGDKPLAFKEFPEGTDPLDYVDASSPEMMDAEEMNPLRWMCGRPVDDYRPVSPIIPTPILASSYHKLPQMERGHTKTVLGPINGEPIDVSFTLESAATRDIGMVLSRLAKILNTDVPDIFTIDEVINEQDIYKSSKVPIKEEAVQIARLVEANSIPCIGCGQPVDSTTAQARRLSISTGEGQRKTVAFCNQSCSSAYLAKPHGTKRPSSQTAGNISATGDESMASAADAVLEPSNDGAVGGGSSENAEPDELSAETRVAIEIAEAEARRQDSRAKRYRPGLGGRGALSSVAGFHGSAASGSSCLSLSLPLPQPRRKKWKGLRWTLWDTRFGQTVSTKKSDDNKIPSLTDSEIHSLSACLRISPSKGETEAPPDNRPCVLCGQLGDGNPDVCSRLLSYDVDQWVHVNCALWSYDVYETVGGMLVNVQKAYLNAQCQRCTICEKIGATLSCFKQRCNAIFHLPCASRSGCAFFPDKTFYCIQHKADILGHAENAVPSSVSPAPGGNNSNAGTVSPSGAWVELKSLAVNRRVFVGRDELSQVGTILFDEENRHTFRISAVIYHSIGGLAAVHIQSRNFNTSQYIYPVGYMTTRFYWASDILATRKTYLCAITEKGGKPFFTVVPLEEPKMLPVEELNNLVTSEDDALPANIVRYRAETPTAAWLPILQSVAKLRQSAGVVRLFPDFTSGEELFGLTDPLVVQLLESMPGVEYLPNYTFKFGRSLSIKHPLPANPSGASRCEPYFKGHSRRPHITHAPPSAGPSSGLSQPLIAPIGSFSLSGGTSKQFQQSKSAQYKKMKMDWRNNVFLAKSRIQVIIVF